MVEFNCPACGEKLQVPESAIGRQVPCGVCFQPAVVPAPTAPAENAFAGIGNEDFSSGRQFVSSRLSHLFGAESILFFVGALATICIPFASFACAVGGIAVGIRAIMYAASGRGDSRAATTIVVATIGCILNLLILGVAALQFLVGIAAAGRRH
jgi:hypothetical protein